MNILKYKKGKKGIYIVSLEDGIELSLYEEVILKYELLIKKEIDRKMLSQIQKDNQEWEVYYSALDIIKSRMKSCSELKKLLINKEYPIDLIDNAINKLESQGYLNDRDYVKAYINSQIITTSKGPLKIIHELSEKGINDNIILEEIKCFNEEEQLIKINKIIEKAIKSNHTRGGNILKQKICNDLKIQGYEMSLINSVIDNYSFENNDDIAKKEYEKLYRKLSRKYSGSELKNKIREKLYLKGLKYEED